MKITNITQGPKVLNSAPPVVLQPGETVDDVELSDAEFETASLTEWFEISGSKKASKPKADDAK